MLRIRLVSGRDLASFTAEELQEIGAEHGSTVLSVKLGSAVCSCCCSTVLPFPRHLLPLEALHNKVIGLKHHGSTWMLRVGML